MIFIQWVNDAARYIGIPRHLSGELYPQMIILHIVDDEFDLDLISPDLFTRRPWRTMMIAQGQGPHAHHPDDRPLGAQPDPDSAPSPDDRPLGAQPDPDSAPSLCRSEAPA